MSPIHPLAERYLDVLESLPDELRVRRSTEDEVAASMTSGHHVVLRGLWHAGKTTLLRGALQRATERTGGAAFTVSLLDERPPASVQAALTHVAARVQEFLTRVGATELKADPARPFEVLGELAAPLFIGVDDVVGLRALGPPPATEALTALLETPKNVKLLLVCDRDVVMDGVVDQLLATRPTLAQLYLGPISDDELVHLVQTPAQALGVSFSNEALGVLAELCGNRPWELLVLCHVVASRLEPAFQGAISPAQVEAVVDLDLLAENDEGRALIDAYLHALVGAVSPEERAFLEGLAARGEGEVAQDVLERLLQCGWLVEREGEGLDLNGDLLAGIVRAVAEGEIKVSVG